MRFRILGPLEAAGEEGQVNLGGIKQRATLGFLLLNANRVVATSSLVEALWPTDTAPATARKILQNAVWGLRGALSLSGRGSENVALLTQAPGYVLQVDVNSIDLHVFQQKFSEGRAELLSGSPEQAARTLSEALDLWRGPILSDLAESGLSWPDLVAAQKSHLDALEDYFQAELESGRHRAVLGALEAQVEAEPLREGFAQQLMTALYRCGRQAEALNVYSRVRRTLIEELGLEPGQELQNLQKAILNQGSSLVVPQQRERAFLSERTPAHAEHSGTALRPDPGHASGPWGTAEHEAGAASGTQGPRARRDTRNTDQPANDPAFHAPFDQRWGQRPESSDQNIMSTTDAQTDHQPELVFLSSLLGRIRYRRTPYLVTVLWECEHSRDHFLSQFERYVSRQPWGAQFFMGKALESEHLSPATSLGSCLRPMTTEDPCSGTTMRLRDFGRLIRTLSVGEDGPPDQGGAHSNHEESWGLLRYLLLGAAQDQPLVAVFDDMHHAVEPLLDFVKDLGAIPRRVPLLVLAFARADLLQRKPGWGEDVNYYTTITIDAVSAPAGAPAA